MMMGDAFHWQVFTRVQLRSVMDGLLQQLAASRMKFSFDYAVPAGSCHFETAYLAAVDIILGVVAELLRQCGTSRLVQQAQAVPWWITQWCPVFAKAAALCLVVYVSGLNHGLELAKLSAKTAKCKTVGGRDAPSCRGSTLHWQVC
jgi:hypothetical protein